MKIREIKVKSILSKSGLEADFVINPYVGCLHGCIYCYARFMKRFTGHLEEWGKFIDVKINAADLVPVNTDKYRGKSIMIGSVTDAYCPLERKYQLTRRILEKLIPLKPRLDIVTKSDLILRDIDLLKQFKYCLVAVSLSVLDEDLRKELEPLAPPADKRINTLKELRQAGIKTALFISPILPVLTDWPKLIGLTKDFIDEYWFENLNLYPSIRSNIFKFLKKHQPKLVNKYKEIYSKSDYWCKEEKQIEKFCQVNKLTCQIYFHHQKR